MVALGVLCSIIVLSFHNRAHTREWKPPNWILTVLNLSVGMKIVFLEEKLTKNSGFEKVPEKEQDENPSEAVDR